MRTRLLIFLVSLLRRVKVGRYRVRGELHEVQVKLRFTQQNPRQPQRSL